MPKKLEEAATDATVDTTANATADATANTDADATVEEPTTDAPAENGEDAEGLGQLEEIFETAVKGADLEEGSDDDGGKTKAGESTTVDAGDETVVETGDAKADADDTTVEPKADATVEEPAKEEPVVEKPAVEPPPAIDPEKLQVDYQEWRSKSEELLASQHYNLTTEQAEEFDTDPGKAIPKLAARLHMEVMAQSVAMMVNLLPQIMSNVSKTQTAETAREKAFFKEWPELTEHRDQVVRSGAVYYQLNPQASFDDFVREVGAGVAVSMKVDLSGRQAATKTETVREEVHKPIAASGGGGARAPVAKPGVFETLHDEMDAFEQDKQ